MAPGGTVQPCIKLYAVVFVVIRNKKLRAYYDKKRAEGKLFKVAIIACVNKLIHWIFAILTTKDGIRL